MKCCFLSAILCFLSLSAYAQTPAELHSWLPPVEGWTIDEKTEVFDPENLFDRINGAAPLYIENNFREMTSMEYLRGDDYITIQAYRHATPQDAFGMYASERTSGLTYYPVGGEAQGDGKNLYFFAGSIYVRMWTNSTDDVASRMLQIAEGLVRQIDPDAGYPAIFDVFPAAGMVPYSQSYTTSNYLGHEFLKGVYTVNYAAGDMKFQLFVMDGGTGDGAREILKQYFAFTRQAQDFAEGELVAQDRFNGDIPILWNGRYIIGIFSESGDRIDGADAMMDEMAGKLAKK